MDGTLVHAGGGKMNRIRALAICVFSNEDKILVFEGFDPKKNQTFYRPLGGGIEYGEYSQVAIRREIKEELGEEIADLRYLGTLENIFVFNGETGHEIVQVYDGGFVNAQLYQRSELTGHEDGGETFKALWKRLDEFNAQTPLYPDGLMEMLT